MKLKLSVPRQWLMLLGGSFAIIALLAFASTLSVSWLYSPVDRYYFVPHAVAPDPPALWPNRFIYSMPVDDSLWGSDKEAITDAIEQANGIPNPVTADKFQIEALNVPMWAEKLHPLHESVVALHRYRTESDPPKHGRKFLIIFPFRDLPIGSVSKHPHTGRATTVTYAERTAQLGTVIPYLDRHLRATGKIPVRDYNFLVMEQADMEVAFTKANVLNAAARLAREWGYDYMVMHDVDYFPAHPDNAYDLPADGLPIHYVSSAPWARGYMTYGHHFGGVYGISVKTYFDVNGYPSEFWGWGPEDNLMLHQCVRAGGVHRLAATTGEYFALEHNSDFKRNTGALFVNNLRRFVAFYLNRREARKVPLEGVNELNATITRYAPMPHLGAVHWATVKLDTLRYRPDNRGVESEELQRKRFTGELPPLSDVGIGEDRFLVTDPPLMAHEIALVQQIRMLEVRSFGEANMTSFLPVTRTFGERTVSLPRIM